MPLSRKSLGLGEIELDFLITLFASLVHNKQSIIISFKIVELFYRHNYRNLIVTGQKINSITDKKLKDEEVKTRFSSFLNQPIDLA